MSAPRCVCQTTNERQSWPEEAKPDNMIAGRERGPARYVELACSSRGERFPSHARRTECLPRRAPAHIPEPIAGSPLKRQGELGVRADGGSVIDFPCMLRAA